MCKWGKDLLNLIEQMTRLNPDERPSIDQIEEKLLSFQSKLKNIKPKKQ